MDSRDTDMKECAAYKQVPVPSTQAEYETVCLFPKQFGRVIGHDPESNFRNRATSDLTFGDL